MTGSHRWAERYDRDVKDVFAVQDEVARTVAAILAAHVSKAEAERTLLKPPTSLQAYDYYMRAAETYATFLHAMAVPAIYETRRLLDQCLAIEPGYARAHISIRRPKFRLGPMDLTATPQSRSLLKRLISGREGCSTRPQFASGVCAIGICPVHQGMPDAAVAEFERAIELNPNFTDWRFSVVLIFAGQAERAIEVAKAHLRVDPFALPIARGYLGLAISCSEDMRRRWGLSVNLSRQSPNHRPGRVWLAVAYAHLGQLGRREPRRLRFSALIPISLPPEHLGR